ncbi:MAG TPA: hypothetical protein VIU62_20095 [Chloroflexota bacterium]
MVVQADGKGVPILRPTTTPAPVRLGKGQKYGGKKEATLTAVYTIAPAVRTAESVVASLFDTPPGGQTRAAAPVERTGPQHKRLWATLAGKEAALIEAAAHVAARDGAHLTDRVALTDGCAALQERVQQQFPAFTLVLDLIHLVEYLWQAANALLGETNPQRTAWVQAHTLLLLQSKAAQVVAEFTALAAAAEQTPAQAKVLRSVAAYLDRNQPWLDDARSLAAPTRSGRGPSPPGSSKAPAAISSRTAANAPACAGPLMAPSPCSICAAPSRTGIGTPSTPSGGANGMPSSISCPTQRRPHRSSWRRWRVPRHPHRRSGLAVSIEVKHTLTIFVR